jgi:microsomal dipeptidase-like Zn-dependent dipeptidase
MKKIIYTLMVLVVTAAIGLFVVIPYMVDSSKNRVEVSPPYDFDPMAERLHQTLSIVDLHADTLLWDRDILKRSRVGHVDLPRLREGNVALQVFSVVTKTPRSLNLSHNDDKSDSITLLALAQLWPWKTLFSLHERALYQAGRLQQYVDNSSGGLSLVRSSDDLKKVVTVQATDQRKKVAAILSLEGAHALEGKIENIDSLYEAGYRIIGLVHFFDNEVGGSAHGVDQLGLTDFGRRLIREMEDRHMLVDLAHASPQLIDEVMAVARRPVVVTHTGVKGTCDQSRNLTDEQMIKITASGGLIGIGFYPVAVCGVRPEHIARAAKYAKELVGIEHIALGSDFDGSLSLPFDVSGLPLLTEALSAEGFSEEDIRLFMGENAIRFLLANLE